MSRKRFKVCEVHEISAYDDDPSFCAKGVWTLEQFNEALAKLCLGLRATRVEVKYTRIKHDLTGESDTIWTAVQGPARGVFQCTWAEPRDVVFIEEALSQAVLQTRHEGEPMAALWRKKSAQGTQARQRNKRARSQKFKVQTVADLDAAEIGDRFFFDDNIATLFWTKSEAGWRFTNIDPHPYARETGTGPASNHELLNKGGMGCHTGIILRAASPWEEEFSADEFDGIEVRRLSDLQSARTGDFLEPRYGFNRALASYLRVKAGWKFGEDRPITDDAVYGRMRAAYPNWTEESNGPIAVIWRRKEQRAEL